MDRRPVSIAIEGDLALGQSYIPEAQQLLFKLRAQMEPGGIATSRAYMDLPDGAYAYAISAMGIDAIRIVVAPGASTALTDVTPKREPDFVSGIAVKQVITGDVTGKFEVMQSFKPTSKCAQLHTLPSGVQPSKRLAVKLNEDFGNSGKYAQSAIIKPTMYSGEMKEVVQLLLGFGRQNKVSIYEAFDETQGTPGEAAKPPTRYEKDVALIGLQVRYDYRFYRTHGIVFGSDGKPWLMEISASRGVLVMPLPLHESTTTAKFREKLVRMGDDDGLRIVNRFGGFPTGESFPSTDSAIDAAVSGGSVIRLKTKDEMQPFYRHTAYSSAMGWAWNQSGTEAHNTAWRYGDDGVQRGVHYCVTVQIGARAEISGNTTARATLSLSAEGNIWWPNRRPPQIKYPEPLVGYLLSHDMMPAYEHAPVSCDTAMHVFFRGDELKVCKLFHGAGQSVVPIDESDEEECMYIGQWTHTIKYDRAVPSMFYTTDYDDREELAGTSIVTKTVGRDLGYTAVSFNDDLTQLWLGNLFRIKSFRVETRTQSLSGVSRNAAIAVPFFMREAYYYAKSDTTLIESNTVAVSYPSLEDPYNYPTWRNIPFLPHPRPHPGGCGLPTRRTVEYQKYEPYPCSDLADSGPWASVCQDVERMAYSVILPIGFASSVTVTNRVAVNVFLTTCSDLTPRKVLIDERSGDSGFYGGKWFTPSPDPQTGDTAFISATHNALGDADVIKYQPNINTSQEVVIGEPQFSEMETQNTTFIGVINGV